MARSGIRNDLLQTANDNGSIRFSVVNTEQSRYPITLKFFTNLAGCKVIGRVIEGDNSGEDGEIPTVVKSGVTSQKVTILQDDGTALVNDEFPSDYTTNTFSLVILGSLFTDYVPQPLPDIPVFGFFDLEVQDTGSGSSQQIYVPIRGTIAVRYKVPE